ncbi:MAG TPA: replicative DNA helicase [Actinocrinis sp.]|uniref:replicative DNA helicase n=1 Tax=Actinocrinis sp. TaxID=1920516 RepID=UPI002DDD7BB3|nr:replicative DNA helicase [Actinocrinis sp.]HEV2345622.1 replicative DNA helicase [Actinocrinis sp.]
MGDPGPQGYGGSSRSSYDRTPPQDLAAEQGVLGGMLLSKDAIADVIDVIKGRDFYKPAHELVFDSILDLYGRGEPADAVTVSAELTKRGELARVGGAPYLHTLMSSVPTAANAGYYAVIVRERAILRRLVEAGTRITQMGYSTDGADLDEIVNRAQAEIYGVTEQRAGEDYAALADIMEGALDEIESISNRSGQMTGVPTGFTDLDQLTNGLHPGQMIILAARPAIGKALAVDTALPTPTGWTTMGAVRVGDFLLGADGRPTRVIAATEVMNDRPCYEVEFSDGAVLVADEQHQWLTETRASRESAQSAAAGYSRSHNHSRNQQTSASVKTTREIAVTLHCDPAGTRINHAVPVAKAAQLPTADFPLSPYVLGVWLGDGDADSARFATTDPEIIENLKAEGFSIAPSESLDYSLPFSAGSTPQCPDCDCGDPSNALTHCQAGHDRHGTVQAVLRHMGMLGDKHIPQDYLRASEAQRRDLLAGLLDTGGYVDKTGAVHFSATNRRLAHDAWELVMSLGYKATMTTNLGASHDSDRPICYMITFTPSEKVFRLPRKIVCQSREHPSTGLRYIIDVRPIQSVPVRCVEVDNDDHLYLAGRTWIPTHNSTLGLDLARSCSIRNGLTSVIFSLEMGRNEITMRLLSAEARVALHHMRSGTMTDDDWARLARRMGEVSAAPLFIDDSPNMSMMEIRAKCRRLKQRHDLRLVVVDYLQLMSTGGSRRPESRQQEVSEMSRALKLLAKELEIPVVAIAQLNRGPEQRTDKRPMMSDLRESGSLEQDADVVILLHREDAYERESPRAGEADLIVAKHRNGPTSTITVAFQGHYSRFVDMAQS